MDELKLQAQVVRAVLDHDGYARKLSSFHTIGIPDLVVKLPFLPVGFIECKMNPMPVRKQHVKLKVTPLQAQTLQEMTDSDILCGIMSFLTDEKRIGLLIHRVTPGQTFRSLVDLQVLTATHLYYSVQDRQLGIYNVLAEFFKKEAANEEWKRPGRTAGRTR